MTIATCESCGKRYNSTAESPGCPRCRPAPEARPRAAGRAATSRPVTPSTTGETGASAPLRRPATVAKGVRRERSPAQRAAPVRQEPEGLLLDKATKYGLLATLGLALVVGLVVLIVFRNKAAAEAERERYEAQVAAVHGDLLALNLEDAVAVERAIQAAEEEKPLWISHALAPEIESLAAKARANLTIAREKREALARFAEIEDQLKQGDLAAEKLKDLRRQLDESEARIADGGLEQAARFALARQDADRQYARRLLEEARAFAAQGDNARPGLVRLQAAEDELKTLLDRAFGQREKEPQDFYTALYKQAIEETDRLANALFQADGDSLAWTDCLSSPQDKHWNASAVRGFSHGVEGGVLRLIGPDPDTGKLAVLSIGDREQWRHFQVDVELTVEKGDLEMYFRLGRGPNQNTLSYPLLTTGSEHNLDAGKKVAARITVIGSRFSVRFTDEDIHTPPPLDESVSWVMNRKGAVGFVISPEARATVTRLRVRELR